MKQSQEIGQLAKALVNFQASIRVLPKPAQGYGYKYTPFNVVVEMIREPMLENGLAFIQMPTSTPGEVGLCTRLLHESGEWLEEEASLPLPSVGKANEAQAYGAGLQYLRRYALVAVLGLAADEDVDAAMPASRNGHTYTVGAAVLVKGKNEERPGEITGLKYGQHGEPLYMINVDGKTLTVGDDKFEAVSNE